ncbi:MAG: hypothetical protein Q7T73_03440 [Beijerinckiaceae bacterium]|nr:hypothetical protein [Beijerinckiaceae bacterium]
MVTAVSRAAVALLVVPVMLVGGLVAADHAHATAPPGSGLSEDLARDNPLPVDVSLGVDDAVYYDGCASIPFEYSFDPSSYADWTARLIITDLTSGQMTTTTSLSASTDEASGSSGTLFCDDERTGLWAATIYVQFFDDAGRERGRGAGDDRFLLREPQTRTSFTLSDSSPDAGQVVAFRIRSEVERPGRFRANGLTDVALQSLGSGGWTRLRGSRIETNKRGVAQFRLTWRSNAPVRIRAVTLKTTDSARSTSGARWVRQSAAPESHLGRSGHAPDSRHKRPHR